MDIAKTRKLKLKMPSDENIQTRTVYSCTSCPQNSYNFIRYHKKKDLKFCKFLVCA